MGTNAIATIEVLQLLDRFLKIIPADDPLKDPALSEVTRLSRELAALPPPLAETRQTLLDSLAVRGIDLEGI